MILELIQKKLFIHREVKIMDTKISYKSTRFGKELEINVPYEELTRNKESYVKTIPYINIAIGFLSVFTFVSFISKNDKDFDPDIWMFWGVLLVISMAVYFIGREILWKVGLQNKTYLFFAKSIPNKEDVNQFIECLFKTRDKYLRETYFFEVTKNISYETQKNNLQWLRRIEAINATEFKEHKKILDGVFSLEAKKIGFN